MSGAGMRSFPVIVTAYQAWLGEAANYNTMMPHGAKINPVGIDPIDKVTLTVSGAIAANATKIVLTQPLNNSLGIQSGMTLTFGSTSVITSEWTSPASKELLIFPSPGTIADAATYAFPGYGARPIRDGIAVGRTFAERDAGAMFGLADANDDEIYLVAFPKPDVIHDNDIDLIRHGTRIRENYLPNFSTYAAGLQTKLRNSYQMYLAA